MRPAINRLLPSISSANAASGVSVLCASADIGRANSRPEASNPAAAAVAPTCKNWRLDGTCFTTDVCIFSPFAECLLLGRRKVRQPEGNGDSNLQLLRSQPNPSRFDPPFNSLLKLGFPA